ncbi:MAG: sugar ABC transporter ATP-binding protein [Alicyclobacillaceae bacterium]|nr:sugar ABC transporter ATP-binding protein [Alicyclobacillaceae bacterium]
MRLFECRHIAKRYGSVVALQDASITVERGEIRAILGGNGSGKSTLSKIIGGAVAPDSGEMFLNGQPYRVHSPAQAKRHRVVFTSQELSLLTNLTVEQNLVLPQIPAKAGVLLDRKAMRRSAQAVLDRLGLADIAGMPAASLPPNRQFMVEFAKALLQQPELLIIDEITSALYREDVEVFKQVVRELSAQGCGILFISHRMPEIFSLCDTVTVMRNGVVVGDHRVDSVDEDRLLELLTGDRQTTDRQAAPRVQVHDGQVLLSVKGLKLPGYAHTLDFEVRKGEVIGIAGLQGQGQSQFVRALFGMYGPVEAVIDNEKRVIRSPREAVRAGLAFLSGDREREGVFARRSIAENLKAVSDGALGNKGLPVVDVLRQVGAKYGKVTDPVVSLSGGNQQKVIIGRWTSVQPKLLLADDPTKGIDVQARHDVHLIFRDLTREGSAVVLVSSDDEELVNIARTVEQSRIIVMYGGRFVKAFAGADVTVQDIIEASIPRREGTHG